MKKYWLLLLAVVLIYSCKRDTATRFVNEINCYSNFSTVDWSELNNKYHRPNATDWDSTMNERIINGFPMEMASKFWHLLQNARTDFYQKSLFLRAEATRNVIDALDRTEAIFDIVFVQCVNQEYYLRLFPEIYNETMNPAINELIENINIYDNQL